jgi:uncharacterized protein (DUF305 family)
MSSARTRTLRTIAVLTVAGLLLLGCGGGDSDGAGSGEHNDADVTFAAEMVPHHEQALLMVDMVSHHEGAIDMARAEIAEASSARRSTWRARSRRPSRPRSSKWSRC